MKASIAALGLVVVAAVLGGCSSERHVRSTTTTREVQTVPVEPVITEQRTIRTERYIVDDD